jgi:outer membrane protein OmpA-like peptidoglycan-associated protein
MWNRILMLCVMAALGGCGLPRNVVVLIPNEDGTVGAISVDANHTEYRMSAAYTADETDAGGQALGVFTTDAKTVDSEFAAALAATPRKPVIFIIYFFNGETVVEPRSADTLNAAIEAARTTPFEDISVVGHTDAVGSDDANLVLSMYRAQTIRADLVRAGVDAAAIEVGYDGANNPRVPRPRGVPEPENRRVEVTIR